MVLPRLSISGFWANEPALRINSVIYWRMNSTSRPDLKQQVSNVRRLIAFDPTHEGASRILMRALAKMGERAQALREYERCRKALKRALDGEPSGETRALADAIRTFSG